MKNWLVVVLVVILGACSGDEVSPEKKVENNEKAKLVEKIEMLAERTDPESVKKVLPSDMHELMLTYQEYAQKYREDSVAADYLFLAANQALGLKKYDHAVELLNKTYESYPEYKKRPSCLMMMGLIFEENLKNDEKAIQAYSLLIENHPDTEEAKNAEAMIQLVGLSDEQLIERFKKQNQE